MKNQFFFSLHGDCYYEAERLAYQLTYLAIINNSEEVIDKSAFEQRLLISDKI